MPECEHRRYKFLPDSEFCALCYADRRSFESGREQGIREAIKMVEEEDEAYKYIFHKKSRICDELLYMLKSLLAKKKDGEKK